ncbi:MAG TPA: hypothetical protein DD405_05460 [Desulfobacteraceae bacterium]|nr:hypothetical protein [Desulfobacteraceae bacterium]
MNALNQLLNLKLFTSKADNNISDKFNTILNDFSPAFLKTEAQNLGLDVDSLDHEDVLKAVHETMEKQRQLTKNYKDE